MQCSRLVNIVGICLPYTCTSMYVAWGAIIAIYIYRVTILQSSAKRCRWRVFRHLQDLPWIYYHHVYVNATILHILRNKHNHRHTNPIKLYPSNPPSPDQIPAKGKTCPNRLTPNTSTRKATTLPQTYHTQQPQQKQQAQQRWRQERSSKYNQTVNGGMVDLLQLREYQ